MGDFSRSRIPKDRTARLKKKKEILRLVNSSHEEVSRGSRAVTSRKSKKRGARACVQSCCFASICFFDLFLLSSSLERITEQR